MASGREGTWGGVLGGNGVQGFGSSPAVAHPFGRGLVRLPSLCLPRFMRSALKRKCFNHPCLPSMSITLTGIYLRHHRIKSCALRVTHTHTHTHTHACQGSPFPTLQLTGRKLPETCSTQVQLINTDLNAYQHIATVVGKKPLVLMRAIDYLYMHVPLNWMC